VKDGIKMNLVLKWAGRIGFVAGVTVLSWFSVAAAVIAISAVILVALQSRAAALIEVSFGPLRAKLERDITQAEKLVEKLRGFAALQAKGIITANTRLGRWQDQSDWPFQSLREIEAALRELGVPEEKINEARSEMVRFTISDLGNAAMGTSRVPMHLGQDAVNEWQEVMQKGLEKTPDEIEAYLKKWNVLSVDRQQRIDDMRWVMAHQDIRDREQFLRAHDPVEWPG
jgi:hypothetical protein